MLKIPECDGLWPVADHRCQRYSDNLHLACAIRPTGPDTGKCLAFAPIAEELTVPVGASYYAGELVARNA